MLLDPAVLDLYQPAIAVTLIEEWPRKHWQTQLRNLRLNLYLVRRASNLIDGLNLLSPHTPLLRRGLEDS